MLAIARIFIRLLPGITSASEPLALQISLYPENGMVFLEIEQRVPIVSSATVWHLLCNAGNLQKEMWRDIRYAFRTLLKARGFSVIVFLTLAVGIGLTTSIFTVLHGVLLQPLPFNDPDRLMILWERAQQGDDYSVAFQNYLDWRSQNSVFENMAASRWDRMNIAAPGLAEGVRIRMVSYNFLSTLGVRPFLGRDFRSDEDRLGASSVAILTFNCWQRLFHGDPKILGHSIQANDHPVTIIGVLPEHFHFYTEVDIFLPIGGFSDQWPKRDMHPGIYVIARLKPELTIQRAQADMNQIAARLEKQYAQTNAGNGVHIETLVQNITGDVRSTLWLLFGSVIFVLLIACANVANMMLARGFSRQKEISIRMALGAGQRNVIRQFLIEGFLLSLAGGIAALFLASYAIDLLTWLRPANLPRIDEIRVDWTVLLFSFFVSSLCGIVCGLLPALRCSYVPLNESMKQGSATTLHGRSNLRSALVISQVCFSVLLLIGSGLMIKSIMAIMRMDPGFQADHLLTMPLSLSPKRYQGQNVLTYLQEAERRIQGLPGVQDTAFANGVPIAGANEAIFWVEGHPKPDPGHAPRVVQYLVSPSYFQTLKIPLIRGRYLLPSDRQNQPWKVVIDEALANKYFPDQDPLGQRLRLSDEFPPFEIVGVVRHVKHYGLDVTAPVESELYMSIRQIPDQFLSMVAQDLHLLIRTGNDPERIVDSVRREMKAMDPAQPASAALTMDRLIADSFAARRFTMLLLSIFAGVALFLAAAGIYGVLSYSVVQRSKEMGIRMAVGAKKTDVLKLVLTGGLRLILIGSTLGILGSLGLSNIIGSQLYAVSARDPFTFVIISILLSIVGLTATYVPASRAMKIDPVSILKYE